MKYTAILIATLIAGPAFAQTLGNTNGLQQDASAQAIVAPGAINIDNSSPGSPAKTELKTTGQAIAPGVYNASGTYNCFGGASVAAGWMGGAVGAGTTVSQAECYRMHLMDKARQANQPVVYAALFCQFPDGKAAYEAAGIPCPSSEAKRVQAVLNGKPVATVSDPYIAARLASQGK